MSQILYIPFISYLRIAADAHARMTVPQLATGKASPSDQRGIQLLQNLIKARNSIVHLKAKNIEWELWDSAEEKITEINSLILESAVKSFECIGLLGHALSELDADDWATKLLATFTSTPKYRIVDKKHRASKESER